MYSQEHISILHKGITVWNEWRENNPNIIPNLSQGYLAGRDFNQANFKYVDFTRANLNGSAFSEASLENANLTRAALRKVNLNKATLKHANLTRTDLSESNLNAADIRDANLTRATLDYANIRGVRLIGANFTKAELREVDFRDADLCGTNFSEAKLIRTNLSGVNLYEANLADADLTDADLSGANLSKSNLSSATLVQTNLDSAKLLSANLQHAKLISTNLRKADLTGCRVFGISAWKVNLEHSIQSNLIITSPEESTITLDNLEIAQFIYLLLNNERIRDVIDTITSKVVLILGRFTAEQKKILESIKHVLRINDYVPVLFDFRKPISRDFAETILILAHMARFVIADITDPKIVLEEIPHIVRNVAVPVKPILLKGRGDEPVTLYNLRRNQRSLLDTYVYENTKSLFEFFKEKIIQPAEEKAQELLAK